MYLRWKRPRLITVTNQMLTQDFLRSGGTLKDLEARFAIKANRSSVHPSLVLLKYNQIDSPMGERLVQECRGLILDEADN